MSFSRFLSLAAVLAMLLPAFAAGISMPAAAKTAKEIRQCKALNKCRDDFTRCYYRIERDPKKSWEKNEWECAKPYKDCIGRNFGTFDMLFTRLFDPRVLDCSK